MINVQIASVSEKIFTGELNQLTVKTVSGEITILTDHAPFMSLIENGYVVINGKKNDIKYGTININDNNVQILIGKE